MDRKRRSFYEFHASIMEPWDGPAAIAFTDGKKIGATLDRNGLRPARYFVSEDDTVVLEAEEIVHDGTLVEATEEDAPVLSESMQRYAAVLGKVATASKQV